MQSIIRNTIVKTGNRKYFE